MALLAAQNSSRRIEYIDLLRGWALVVMIETHVMNATLTESATAGDLFRWITFVNGLVAPSFLFASGLAFAVTTRRKLNDYLSFGPLLFRRVRRLLFILAAGYLLHVPKFNFDQLLHETTREDWLTFFQVDILQCIAVSLLVLQVFLLLLRNERRLYYFLICITAGIVIISPFVWEVDFLPILSAPFAAYMNGLHSSLFPLFPWSAFLFAGAITGYFYLGAVQGRGTGLRMMQRLISVALVVIILSYLADPVASRLYGTYAYWKASPAFFLLRLGLVMCLCAGMFFYEHYRQVSPRSAITLVGRESLIVYVLHLLLIYGTFGGFSVVEAVHHSFGYFDASIATVFVLVTMYLLALAWEYVKRFKPFWKRSAELGTAILLLVVFFFGPGQ